jgi:hypothetical protein
MNTFLSPFGVSSLDKVEGTGPVTVVLENLTAEGSHGEYAKVTVNYIDASGTTQTYTITLDAVDADKRDVNTSYKKTITLDCGVQAIWFSATIYRVTISEEEDTVTVDQTETTVNYTTAAVDRKTDSEGNVVLEGNTFTAYTATQLPNVQLLVDSHYKCGDVIVAGVMDELNSKGNIVLQTYATATYVDVASLPGTTKLTNGLWYYYPPDSTTGVAMLAGSSSYLLDSSNNYIQGEYPYPAAYSIIPVVYSNVSGLSDVIDDANEAIEQTAIEYSDD